MFFKGQLKIDKQILTPSCLALFQLPAFEIHKTCRPEAK